MYGANTSTCRLFLKEASISTDDDLGYMSRQMK